MESSEDEFYDVFPHAESSVRASVATESAAIATVDSAEEAATECSANAACTSDGEGSNGRVLSPKDVAECAAHTAKTHRKLGQRVASPTSRDRPCESSPTASVLSAGWGGVVSALGSLRSGLYDMVDGGTAPSEAEALPNASSPDKYRALVEDMAPESSVLDGIDRTLDYATDRLGKVLIGSFRSFGIALETVSPGAREGSASPMANGGSVQSPDAAGAPVPSLSANVVSAGLSTLERIGRRTAGIVISARDRMAAVSPSGVYALQPVSRDELRGRSFEDQFASVGGLAAMEKLQVASSTAAVAYKALVRSLPAEDAAALQESLRGVSFDAGESASPSVGASVPWAHVPLLEVCADAIAEIDRLPPTPIEAAADCNALRALVYDTDLPPDPAALLAFLARHRAAVVASACVRVLSVVDYTRLLSSTDSAGNGVALIAEIVSASLGGILGSQQYAKAADVLSAARQEALLAQLSSNVDAASSTVRDAATALAPVLRHAAMSRQIAGASSL